MVYPKRVFITEVGPRDGLQMEKQVLSTDQKTQLINGLVKAGVSAVQVASFINPGKLPQMAEAEAIFTNQDKKKVGIAYMTGRLPLEKEKKILSQMLSEGDPSNKLAGKTYKPTI